MTAFEIMTKPYAELGISKEFQGLFRWVWATKPQVPLPKILSQYNKKFGTAIEIEEVLNNINILCEVEL